MMTFNKKNILLITGVVFAMAISTTVSVVISKHQQQKIVSFDMKETVNTFIKQAADLKLSQEENKRLSEKFSRAVNDSITDYQIKNNAVIMVAPAVVNGAENVTEEIRSDVAIRMQGK